MRTKDETYEREEVRLADAAKAIGHPARIAILKLLAERNTCICGEIVDDLPLAQSTVSQHLKALKAAGFVQGEIDGTRSCYCIDWKGLEAMREAMTTFFNHLDALRRTTCC